MKTLRNTVQFIGKVVEDPKPYRFENGMLVCRLNNNEQFFKDGEI